MASGTSTIKWGKTCKGFAEYLRIGAKPIGRATAKRLSAVAADFLANEDWDWPRGQRYDAFYAGRTVRAAMPYKSGFRGGDAMHPWYSGNLHDSMAAGVMQGTRILSEVYMNPGASENQKFNGALVDGVFAGHEALAKAARMYAPPTAIRTVLVIGVPYADYINTSDMIGWQGTTPNTHKGFVEYFEREFVSSLAPAIEHLRKVRLRLK